MRDLHSHGTTIKMDHKIKALPIAIKMRNSSLRNGKWVRVSKSLPDANQITFTIVEYA